MERVKEFVETMILQTEEDIESQRKVDPKDEWMRFLEGRLLAFRLVLEYILRIEKKQALH